MSVSSPARCLLQRTRPAIRPAAQCTRQIHTSSPLQERRRSRFKSLSAEEMGLVTSRKGKSSDSNAVSRADSEEAESASESSRPAENIPRYPGFDDPTLDVGGLKRYTAKELRAMQSKNAYSEQQMQAVKWAESAIDRRDLYQQGRVRVDIGRPTYFDDMSIYRGVIDHKADLPPTKHIPHRKARMVLTPEDGNDGKLTGKVGDEDGQLLQDEDVDDRELDEGLAMAFTQANVPYVKAEQEARKRGTTREAEWAQYCRQQNPPLDPETSPDPLKPTVASIIGAFSAIDFVQYKDRKAPGRQRVDMINTVLAPTMPVQRDIKAAFSKGLQKVDETDPEGKYLRLKRMTGLTLSQLKSLKQKVVVDHRVVQQTRLGKIQSYYVLAVAGNGNGMLGLGSGKAKEPDEARFKAFYHAIVNMKPVMRYEDRTIFGDVEGKVGATTVKIYSKGPGHGLRCKDSIFEMCRCAGLHDIAAVTPGSRNKMNVVKAAYQALMSQRHPDDVARGLGRKLVDVRKVYYGGVQELPQKYVAELEELRRRARDGHAVFDTERAREGQVRAEAIRAGDM